MLRLVFLILVRLFQKVPIYPLVSIESAFKVYGRGCALDEVGLVGAGCVDGRCLSSGLLAGTTEGHITTTEQGTEDAHSELENNSSQQWELGGLYFMDSSSRWPLEWSGERLT